MQVYDTEAQIALFRLKALKGALKLEMLGMKRGGQSACSIIKEEFGFRGNRKKVLKQLELKIEETVICDAVSCNSYEK